VLGSLEESEFARPTNCPPWTLKDLVVHIDGTIRLPASWQPGTGPRRTAADYYRRPERSTAAYREYNVERTQRASARYESGIEVVGQLERTQTNVVTRLESEDLRRVIDTANVSMTVGDYVATRVLAVAAHGLDVAITLDRAPVLSPSTLAVCTPILTDLLGAPIPDALDWTSMEFFARATGRASLDAHELALLGASASQFPLVS
jgi:hypothetical protein